MLVLIILLGLLSLELLNRHIDGFLRVVYNLEDLAQRLLLRCLVGSLFFI